MWYPNSKIYKAEDGMKPSVAKLLLDNTTVPDLNYGCTGMEIIPEVGLFFSTFTSQKIFFYDVFGSGQVTQVFQGTDIRGFGSFQNADGEWKLVFFMTNDWQSVNVTMYEGKINTKDKSVEIYPVHNWNIQDYGMKTWTASVVVRTKDEKTTVVGFATISHSVEAKFFQIDSYSGKLDLVYHWNTSVASALLSPDEKTIYFSSGKIFGTRKADFPGFANVVKIGEIGFGAGGIMASNGESLFYDEGFFRKECGITKKTYFGETCVVSSEELPDETNFSGISILKDYPPVQF